MSTYLGKTLLSGVATNTISNAHSLLDFKWTDHILNEMSWLRADTFSWHSGNVYVGAYNHLENDYNTVTKPEVITVVLENQTSPFVDGTYYKTSETFSGLDMWRKDNDPNGAVILIYPDAVIAAGTTVYNTTFAQSSISYVNDGTTRETIGSYTIAYYLSSDGHKIVMPDQETTVANIYNESGVAWYYILDTTNQRFKLPRELPITDKSKGNGMTLGLTDGTNLGGLCDLSNASLGRKTNYYGSNIGTTTTGSAVTNQLTIGITTDPTKSGIISHRENENGKQYLYFYVGQYSQSAIEQTAGLNSELFNGKVDLNAENFSNTGKSLIAGLSMPSDTYEDWTLGATGSKYTAPANGFLEICLTSNSSSSLAYIILVNEDTRISSSVSAQNGAEFQTFIPVCSGEKLAVYYVNCKAYGQTYDRFQFVYAKGSESEAS